MTSYAGHSCPRASASDSPMCPGEGTPTGDGVERAEALIDADRVVGAEDGDGRAELDPLGAAGNRREHHLGRADGEVRAMVLTHAEEIHPYPVRQLRLGDDVAEHARLR